jgi:hypothetical protein
MRKTRVFMPLTLAILVAGIFFSLAECKAENAAVGRPAASQSYGDLLALGKEFREFQKPKVTAGVPDYTAAAMAAQKARIKKFQDRLAAINPASWPVAQRVDYEIIRAEMNGLEFDHRVLRPWSRDPAFYAVIETSEPDVPAREGAQVFGCLCLADYKFPLDEKDAAAVREKLAAIPHLLAQAKTNLVEDARDFYRVAIRQKKDEIADFENLAKRLAVSNPGLFPLVEAAKAAADDFRRWLEAKLPSLKGPSGIGKAEYDWYQKNVHLVPYSWDEQQALVARELERSLAYLQLEEHRNRRLPPLLPPATREEQEKRMKEGVAYFMDFLRRQDIFTVAEGMALNDRVGGLVPAERRDFFTQVDYLDVLPLRTHAVHWLEKQREKGNPHPIRGTPLLYNIWDSRAEGFATAFEEMMMGAGLFDHNPRSRELVYIMLAFRAIRAMIDLKLHSNEWTVEEAIAYAVKTTPYGWVLPEGGTIWGDLTIYLHQPGYGTSYLVGKVQVEKSVTDYALQKGDAFTLKAFLDEMFAKGIIPQSLVRWEMTGLDDEMKKIWK